MTKNFAKTGKDVYQGVKYILSDIFEENSRYSHTEIIKEIDELKSKGLSIYVYKNWKKAYDFLKFLIKIDIINYENHYFMLGEIGLVLKKILRYSEEEFKNELFKYTYISSIISATRFKEFCDFLRFQLSETDTITNEMYELAKVNILKAEQMTNRDAIQFLLDLDVIKKKNNEIKINPKRFIKIDLENIVLNIIKLNIDKNKTISLEDAILLLENYNINPDIIFKLEAQEKIAIRSVRRGRYLDFS